MTGGVFGPANSPTQNPPPRRGQIRQRASAHEITFSNSGPLTDSGLDVRPGTRSPYWPHQGITIYQVDVAWSGVGAFDVILLDRDDVRRFDQSIGPDVFPEVRQLVNTEVAFARGEMCVFLETGTGTPEDITVVVRYAVNQPTVSSPTLGAL